MSPMDVIEIAVESPDGFEEAIRRGVAEAAEAAQEIRATWVAGTQLEQGREASRRLELKVAFVLD